MTKPETATDADWCRENNWRAGSILQDESGRKIRITAVGEAKVLAVEHESDAGTYESQWDLSCATWGSAGFQMTEPDTIEPLAQTIEVHRLLEICQALGCVTQQMSMVTAFCSEEQRERLVIWINAINGNRELLSQLVDEH